MSVEKTERIGKEWLHWGPYLAERQWGTVREDYSADGSAWGYLTHDHSRSRAYRWGEDGIAGISDIKCKLCFSVGFWNEKDSILKERLFGLSGPEGNHGEDVKELYYYLDSTPSHSYMKMLYKYPQAEFPYGRFLEESHRRGKHQTEFELADTGIFNENRYWDIFIEYAKVSPTDILVKITAHNRGPDAATLHMIPQLWFRNTWSWDPEAQRPVTVKIDKQTIKAGQEDLGDYHLHVEGETQLLFTDNDTNAPLLFGAKSVTGYFKDGFHEAIVKGNKKAINGKNVGTKAGAWSTMTVPSGESWTMKLRLRHSATAMPKAFQVFDSVFEKRVAEADEFYTDIQHGINSPDVKLVQRQAFAGMLWSKQFYYYDLRRWLEGDPGQPPPPIARSDRRNAEWLHLFNKDIISMPDKWEYPWYAAWDLAFHCIPLSIIDGNFAKEQLLLLLREWYMHPNGQLPAYEWTFSDVNPPVHAWAAWRVYKIEKKHNGGAGDIDFLEKIFHKLCLNFTWWVNRKDTAGNNIFQGGFLGLDNIGVFDRSRPLPTGGYIEQADGTAWMAMYSLNMMRIALELAAQRPVYQDMASKFFEHFLLIAEAMMNMGKDGIPLWNAEDEFYYDVLHVPGRAPEPLKIRSLVGLIPLFAVETLDPELLLQVPEFKKRLEWILGNRPELAELVSRWQVPGKGERRLLSLLRGHRMKKVLKRMLDENEFLSPYGIRALSKYHLEHPFVYETREGKFTVQYTPGESDSGLFGGNSNWRGPIWFPTNYLIIESLQKFHHYYGPDFKVECPTGSGNFMTLEGVAAEISRRLSQIFLLDEEGKRAVFGADAKMQSDPHFKDYPLFFEYFHGDTGSGLGASHQTGWTGLVAKLLMMREADDTVVA